jgi:GNAT superfamily N-acetyltransferase
LLSAVAPKREGHSVLSRQDSLVLLSTVTSGDDISALQHLASACWPAGWHPGGLGWALARGELADEVVLLRDGDDTLGWAGRGAHDEGELLAQVRAGDDDVAELLVGWLLDRPAPRLHVDVYDGDSTLAAALIRVGFVAAPEHRSVGMFRPVNDNRDVAAGYVVRGVRADETDARVEAHRAAWRPAAQPWADGRSLDPAAESSFTHAAYEAVRGTWLYDPELDLVAVAPDGTLAGCCIAWHDQATGVAEIEPLGVIPEHRRCGVAGAMCEEAARRVAHRGGRALFINTGPRDEYPAPAGAYLKVGFEVVERATRYERDRGP